MKKETWMRHRWGDNDHYFGPFTYARDTGYRHGAVVLSSGDEEDEDRARCRLRISGFGHTLIVALPPIIRPYRQKVVPNWDAATVARLGRDWYWQTDKREYGFSLSEGHLHVRLGRQTHDSSTTRDWGCFLPWTQWRHVRTSLYGLDGSHFWTEPPRVKGQPWNFDARHDAEDRCPSVTFAFNDFDGEQLTARTRIEEMEWLAGEGWFRWLSLFRAARVRRSLDIHFSGEVGRRKGSWKGGTIGHSINMPPGELHEAAFRRYCAENGLTFLGAAP